MSSTSSAKSGLLFVYDLEAATAIYRNKVSNDPVFIACGAPSNGGFYAINRRGQVLLMNLNEPAVVRLSPDSSTTSSSR